MSEAPGSRVARAGPVPGPGAGAQLAGSVRNLCQARLRQMAVEHLAAALAVALLISAALVLAIRMALLDLPPLASVLAVLAAAAVAALASAWWRRPDDLDVGVAADLKLNLKQRMSTAWELHRTRGDDELTRRLATQAVRARLPGRSVTVFPLRVNAMGLLVPVAAIVLVLVSIVDLPRTWDAQAPEVDESVAAEGLRLREYGVRMQARARRDELPRSAAQSRRLQQLGNRMHAGGLSRNQALARLRELDRELEKDARAALEQGPQTDVGPLDTRDVGGEGAGGDARATALLQRLRDGALGEGDLRALAADPGALSRGGVTGDELERALERMRQGDDAPVRDILERLSRAEQGRRDARELEAARERLDRARENLGGAPGVTPTDRGRPPAMAGGGDQATDRGPDGPLADEADGENGVGGSDPGTAPEAATDRRRARVAPPGGAAVDGPVLEARARPGPRGETFVSSARALPRANAVRIAPETVDRRFRPQLEAVLANEHVPAHHKEFIRRYFLRLSDGAPGAESQR